MSRSGLPRSSARRGLVWLAVAGFAAAIVTPVAMLDGRVEQRLPAATIVGSPPPATVEAAGATVQKTRRSTRKATRSASAARRARVTGFSWPVGGSWAVTSPFGVRGEEGDDFHHGMDIGCATGDPIRASFPGRIAFAGEGGAYGQAVLLDHGSTWQTLYGHLSGFQVGPGDWVNQGEIIGMCGSTGRSTGPHLHFEIRYDGHVWDPAGYLPA